MSHFRIPMFSRSCVLKRQTVLLSAALVLVALTVVKKRNWVDIEVDLRLYNTYTDGDLL